MTDETQLSNEKQQHLREIEEIIRQESYTVEDKDFERPWGGFIRLNNNDAKRFIGKYFSDIEFDTYENMSPKFLLVAPGKRLSWQVHNRRAELWRVLEGPVGVKLSETDSEPDEVTTLATGETIQFDAGVRHRLIGLDSGWGIVTEIWKHTESDNLSDESDIIRIQDDFGR